MSALTCDICGGNLTMNGSGDFVVCESCGMKHTKERVKVKVQEVEGVVEITKGEAEKERLLKNAESFFALDKIVNAENIYHQLTNDYPDDYRGWMGLLKCQCCHSYAPTCFEANRESVESGYQELFSNICSTATTIQKLNGFECQEVVLHINLFLENILKSPQYTYAYVKIFKNKFKELGEFKKHFSDKQEKVLAFDKIKNDFEASYKLKFQTYDGVHKQSKVIYNNAFYRHNDNYSGRTIECLFCFENYIGFRIHETAWEPEVIVYFEASQKFEDIITEKIQEEQQKTIIERKKHNVCQHCGGEFEGVFKKVCSKCGKQKDY